MPSTPRPPRSPGRAGSRSSDRGLGIYDTYPGLVIPALDTLTSGVGRLVSGQLGAATEGPLKLAAAAAMTIPVAIVFFVFQKYIMRTDQGALKE